MMGCSPATGWTDLSDAVFFHAERRAEKVALIEGGNRVTYAELAGWIRAATGYLDDIGVKPREVVALILPETIDHVILTLALTRVRAVPLDLPLPPPEQTPLQMMQPFGIRRAFVAAGVSPPAGLVVHTIDALWRDSLPLNSEDRRIEGNPDEDFYLSFTSGSTGAPKAIVTTRRQWQARYCTARKLFPFLLAEPPPYLLVVGGMAFSAFFFFLANHLFAGGTAVLMGGAHDPVQLAAAINGWDDAAMLITPPLAREFLARAPRQAIMFPRMRALFVGAAPFSADEKLAVQARLSPNSYEIYGSAAAGFLSSHQIDAHADSVGRPVGDVEIGIVDKDGQSLAPGRTGHIRCRGAGISQGFFGQAPGEPGAEGFFGGWYYPGDLGAMDENGYLTLKGRVADVIRRRGVEIYPPDLEEVYRAHPAIGEVAAVGARTHSGGDDPQVVVFVVGRGELQQRELSELTRHCRRFIPPERFPDQLFCLNQLPKTGNGKVDRPRLTAMAEQALRTI
jgi:acyl-CoA synthetase (AMP-forming)/AMP-acid ligase II